MRTLTKGEFLTKNDLPLEAVKLPEVYGEDAGFYVRTMTGVERSEIERQAMAGNTGKKDPCGFRATILMACIVDENGKHIFDKHDRKALMDKNAANLEIMFEAACRLNGFTADDVEEIEKN